MKAVYIRKTIYLIFLLAVLFSAGCGTDSKIEPDPIGIKIKSPRFDEISTIYSDVDVSLKFTNNNSGGVTECNVFIGTDTKVKGTCGDMPFGTYAYILEYRYQDLTVAKSIGSITIDEDNTETPITLLDKSIDEDNDGCSNLQEVIVHSNPLVQDTCIPPPTDLTANAVSTIQIDLTWTESSGATGYKIFRREGADGVDTEIGTSTQTSYSDTSLNADTEYCYKVSATGNGVESIPTELVCTRTENGLVAYYPFNGNANDESGNGNNGTVNGATLTADRFGNADSAYSFDGNDYIVTPQSQSIEPINSVTVMAWVNPNDITTWHQVITKRFAEITTPFNSYIIDTTGNDINKKWQFSVSTGMVQTSVADTEVIKPNTWTCIAGVYDGSYIKLFINGILKSSKQKSGNIDYSSLPLRIGAAIITQPQYMNGLIDDIRIYNRALTDAEVLALYNEGK